MLESAPMLHPHYTFETFAVGEENRQAYEVASSALSGTLPPGYIGLLFGAKPVGKTHLLQAVAHRAPQHAKYVSALSLSQLLFDLPKHTLLIDNIQDTAVTEESTMAAVLKRMHDLGRTVLMSADMPANVFSTLFGKMQVLVQSVPVAPPHLDLRSEILASILRRAHIAGLSLSLPREVLQLLVKELEDGRELEAAVFHLSTIHREREIEYSLVHSAIERAKTQKLSLSIAHMSRCVATYYGLRLGDMASPCRRAHVARPRQVAMYLAKLLLGYSLPKIGEAFGNRDHTTVLHALRTIPERMGRDPNLTAQVLELRDLFAHGADIETFRRAGNAKSAA